jgi:hypothetical protein
VGVGEGLGDAVAVELEDPHPAISRPADMIRATTMLVDRALNPMLRISTPVRLTMEPVVSQGEGVVSS